MADDDLARSVARLAAEVAALRRDLPVMLASAVAAAIAAERAASAAPRGPAPRPAPTPPAGPPASLDEHQARERRAILESLERHGWNRVAVSKDLGIPRRTLYRRLADYGISTGEK